MNIKDFLLGLGICGGGYVGWKYYKSFQLAKKLDFKLVGVAVNGTNGRESFQLGLKVRVTNKSNEDTIVSGSKLKCYANGRIAGYVVVPYTQRIKPNGETIIYLTCDIVYKNAFSEWWNLFIMSSTSINITIAGSLSFNGVFVPIPQFDIYEFSLKDVFESM